MRYTTRFVEDPVQREMAAILREHFTNKNRRLSQKWYGHERLIDLAVKKIFELPPKRSIEVERAIIFSILEKLERQLPNPSRTRPPRST